MAEDYLGNPLADQRAATVEAINDFIGGFLAYETRAEHIFAAADADPQSVLANVYAGLGWMFLEAPEANERAAHYLHRSEQASSQPTARERRHIDLLRAWVGNDIPRVLQLSEQLLDEHPRDLLALKLNQYLEFNRGNSPAMLRIALKAAGAADDVAHLHGMLAFAYEQCHLLDDAEREARLALELLPREPWAQHALAHVLLTQGRIEEGTAHMEASSSGWEGLNSFMYTHNWWHLALFYLARGQDSRALELYDRHVWGIVPDYSQDQVGAIALLVRLELAGIDVGSRWQELVPYLVKRKADRVLPFLSLQYLYGLARAGRPEADELLAALRAEANEAPAFSRVAWAEVSVPAAEGLLAHARGEYALAAQRLNAVLPRLLEIGGSHAQRDLFAQIALDAQLQDGQHVAAQQVLELRRQADPDDVVSNRKLARLYQQLGLPALALEAEQRVRAVLG